MKSNLHEVDHISHSMWNGVKSEKVAQDFLSIGNRLDCEKWVLVGGEEFKSGTDVNWKGPKVPSKPPGEDLERVLRNTQTTQGDRKEGCE